MSMLSILQRGLLCAAFTVATAAQAVPLTGDYKSFTVFDFTTSGVHDKTDPYLVGGGEGVAWEANLLPATATNARSFSTVAFDILTAAFPQAGGRTYASAARELSPGSLIMRTDDVLGSGRGVGAEIHVEYKPGIGDPTTDIHWIQVIATNHKLGAAHGTEDYKVDVVAGNATPYYDPGFAADTRNFLDTPSRGDSEESHIWLAQLMLVTGPANGVGAITFLGGINWGWENHKVGAAVATFTGQTGLDFVAAVTTVPEPASRALLLLGLLAVAGWPMARRRAASASHH